MYIYTNTNLTKIFCMNYFYTDEYNTAAEKALVFRKMLEKRHKEPIVVWTDVAGDNEKVDLGPFTITK